jgi:hypothetical protein
LPDTILSKSGLKKIVRQFAASPYSQLSFAWITRYKVMFVHILEEVDIVITGDDGDCVDALGKKASSIDTRDGPWLASSR